MCFRIKQSVFLFYANFVFLSHHLFVSHNVFLERKYLIGINTFYLDRMPHEYFQSYYKVNLFIRFSLYVKQYFFINGIDLKVN